MSVSYTHLDVYKRQIYKLCDRTMVMGQGEILVSKDTKELFEQPERVIAVSYTHLVTVTAEGRQEEE